MRVQDTNAYYRSGQATVGTSAVKINALADGNRKGILIKAHGSGDDAANTVPVFVGPAQVTINSGFSIAPGESITVPVSGEGDDVYVVASANSQVVSWMVV